MTSPRFWAFVSGNTAVSLTMQVMTTCIPLFLGQVLKFNGKSSGLANMFPFVAKLCSEIIASILTDGILKRRLVAKTTIRKINGFVGIFFPAFLFVCLGYVGCNKMLALSSIIIAMATFGFSKSGAPVNALDIAPSYAGTVYAIGSTFSQVTGFIAPVIMGNIVNKNPESLVLWRYTLLVFSALMLMLDMIFVIFSTARAQPWGMTAPNSLSQTYSDVLTRSQSSSAPVATTK